MGDDLTGEFKVAADWARETKPPGLRKFTRTGEIEGLQFKLVEEPSECLDEYKI